MKDRVITIGLVVVGVVAGFLMRGPITTKVNSYQMANWINGNCEIKQRQVVYDDPSRSPRPGLYIHCE